MKYFDVPEGERHLLKYADVDGMCMGVSDGEAETAFADWELRRELHADEEI